MDSKTMNGTIEGTGIMRTISKIQRRLRGLMGGLGGVPVRINNGTDAQFMIEIMNLVGRDDL